MEWKLFRVKLYKVLDDTISKHVTNVARMLNINTLETVELEVVLSCTKTGKAVV